MDTLTPDRYRHALLRCQTLRARCQTALQRAQTLQEESHELLGAARAYRGHSQQICLHVLLAWSESDHNLITRCAWCQRLQTRAGRWVTGVEEEALGPVEARGQVTHGLCPDCYQSLQETDPLLAKPSP